MNIKRLKLGFLIGLSGIVGAVTCGFISMPYVMETVTKASEKASEVLINKVISLEEYNEINKLIVDGDNKHVSISKSDKEYSYIEIRTDKYENVDAKIDFNEDSNELTVLVSDNYADYEPLYKKGMSTKEFIDAYLLGQYESNYTWRSSVHIYLTDAVDIEVSNFVSYWDVFGGDVFKDELTIKDSFGVDLCLPENHNLKKIDIVDEYEVSMNSEDIRAVEEVNITCNNLILSNMEYGKNLSKMDDPVTNLNISADDSIYLNFNDLLAKNINIDNAKCICIEGDFENYPVLVNANKVRRYENNSYNEYNVENGTQKDVTLNDVLIGNPFKKLSTNVNIKSNIDILDIEFMY